MTETIELDDETYALVREVFESLAQGYTITVPTEDKQEMYLEALGEITGTNDKKTADDSVPDTDGDFDFETDDILP